MYSDILQISCTSTSTYHLTWKVKVSQPECTSTYQYHTAIQLFQNPDESGVLHPGWPHQLGPTKTNNLKHSNCSISVLFIEFIFQRTIYSEPKLVDEAWRYQYPWYIAWTPLPYQDSYVFKVQNIFAGCDYDAGLKRYEIKEHRTLNLQTCKSLSKVKINHKSGIVICMQTACN